MEVQRQLDAEKGNVAKRVEVEYTEAVNRERILQKQVADTKGEFDLLNARSFEYRSLQQEADADKKIYEELFEKEEAGINAGFEGDALRLADPAGPSPRAVFPKVSLNLLLAFLLSTAFGVGAVLLGDMLDNTVRSPEQAHRLFGVDVVGILAGNVPAPPHLIPCIRPVKWRRASEAA